MSKLYYTWTNLEQDVAKLAAQIPRRKFQSLLLVTRGGLVLGGLLSHYLQIKTIETVSVSSYEGTHQQKRSLLKSPQALKMPLIVDDLADSGKTLAYIQDSWQYAPIATLFYKPQSIIKPDYYVHTTTRWVVFPWET